ncbi:MAG: hypothetical protein HY231_09545 [Acidobacteria bacterium]|nr:hypothetical protein [Acidobacteriota bacterium]
MAAALFLKAPNPSRDFPDDARLVMFLLLNPHPLAYSEFHLPTTTTPC